MHPPRLRCHRFQFTLASRKAVGELGVRFNTVSTKSLKVVREFDGILPDGTKSHVKISLGEPYSHGNSFRCPVTIEGIHFEHQYPDIGGSDAMQSILLAIELSKGMIKDFLDHGGMLFYPNTDVKFEMENW